MASTVKLRTKLKLLAVLVADVGSLIAVGVYLSPWLAVAIAASSLLLGFRLVSRWEFRDFPDNSPLSAEAVDTMLRGIVLLLLFFPGLLSDLLALYLLLARRRLVEKVMRLAAKSQAN